MCQVSEEDISMMKILDDSNALLKIFSEFLNDHLRHIRWLACFHPSVLLTSRRGLCGRHADEQAGLTELLQAATAGHGSGAAAGWPQPAELPDLLSAAPSPCPSVRSSPAVPQAAGHRRAVPGARTWGTGHCSIRAGQEVLGVLNSCPQDLQRMPCSRKPGLHNDWTRTAGHLRVSCELWCFLKLVGLVSVELTCAAMCYVDVW